jgi:DNA mismatch repair ATPase MutS
VDRQPLRSVRIFVASSAELAAHRDAVDLHVRQFNDRWLNHGLHLELVPWENFLDAMSATLAGFNAQDLAVAHAAAAVLLAFAELAQGQALARGHALTVERANELLELPPTTPRNLEFVQTLRGESSPTVLSL